MSKVEKKAGIEINRRKLLQGLGLAVATTVIGTKKSVAETLSLSFFENNEWARRDIIIAIDPSAYGDIGYNTVKKFRDIIISTKISEETLTKNIERIGVEEFRYFRYEEATSLSNRIFSIIQALKTSISIQKQTEKQEERQAQKKKETTETGESDIEILHRQEIETDMEYLRNNKVRTVKGTYVRPKSIPDPEKENDYYGGREGMGKNISGKFVNKLLAPPVLKSSLEIPSNIIFVRIINGKYFLAFYREGILDVATYVSIGTSKNRTISNVVMNKSPSEIRTDKYHVSSEYPEDNPGASMPYAVHISGGMRFHGSGSTIDGDKHSHGCVRTPLYYIKRLFDQVNEISSQGQSLTIDIGNLY